jgi:hypothetical protein
LSIQHHDYTPGIASSGLFWTIQVPDKAVSISAHTVSIALEDVPVIDSFVIFGPNPVPATCSFQYSLEATGEVRHLEPASSDPNDRFSLRGLFRDAAGSGTFSAQSITMPGGAPFSFENAVAVAVWAEIGSERNGSFIH